VTFSVIGVILLAGSSGFLHQQADAAKGLRVIVHNGQGNVCVKSANEDLGCESSADNGETVELDFSPGSVEVGETFTVCDDNGCVTKENSPAKAPEHVYMSSSGGGQEISTQSDEETGTYQEGYNSGYEDGLNHPFDQSILNGGKSNQYVKGYEDGFTKGCLSVEGNDKDTCNSAMDK
jgi:hypothetical protein